MKGQGVILTFGTYLSDCDGFDGRTQRWVTLVSLSKAFHVAEVVELYVGAIIWQVRLEKVAQSLVSHLCSWVHW